MKLGHRLGHRMGHRLGHRLGQMSLVACTVAAAGPIPTAPQHQDVDRASSPDAQPHIHENGVRKSASSSDVVIMGSAAALLNMKSPIDGCRDIQIARLPDEFICIFHAMAPGRAVAARFL